MAGRKPGKKQKCIGPRVFYKTAAFYQEAFLTTNTGARVVLESFPGLYHTALKEIFATFSAEEMVFIIAKTNGPVIPEHLGKVCLGRMEVVKGSGTKGLIRRIGRMGVFYRFCLEVLASEYWHKNYADDEMDIPAFLKSKGMDILPLLQ